MGVVLASQLKTALRHEFDRFLNPPMAKNMQKQLVFVGQNEDACFCAMNALEVDLGEVLGGKLARKREPRQAKTGQD